MCVASVAAHALAPSCQTRAHAYVAGDSRRPWVRNESCHGDVSDSLPHVTLLGVAAHAPALSRPTRARHRCATLAGWPCTFARSFAHAPAQTRKGHSSQQAAVLFLHFFSPTLQTWFSSSIFNFTKLHQV